jgi:signal peptidase I
MHAEGRVTVSLKHLMVKRGFIDVPSHGFSMFPLIRTGYICRFVPVEPSELKKGEIVLFTVHNQTMVGHRYYGMRKVGEETYYLFRGDSNPSYDPLIHGEQIMGRMVWIRKQGRTLHTGSTWMKLWGMVLVRFPQATRLIHYVLRFRRSRRGMSISPWIS